MTPAQELTQRAIVQGRRVLRDEAETLAGRGYVYAADTLRHAAELIQAPARPRWKYHLKVFAMVYGCALVLLPWVAIFGFAADWAAYVNPTGTPGTPDWPAMAAGTGVGVALLVAAILVDL